MVIYINELNHKASLWTCSSSAGKKGQLKKQQDGKDDDDNDNDDLNSAREWEENHKRDYE